MATDTASSDAAAEHAGFVAGDDADDLTLRAIVADTADFFRACLEDPVVGRRARRALASRGLSILSAADGIGYAPEGWTTLTTHLQELGYTDEHLLAAGISARCRTSQLIDRFRARITFAVHDRAGDVVGFTARAFDDDRAAAAAVGTSCPSTSTLPRRPCTASGRSSMGCTRTPAPSWAQAPSPSWWKAPPMPWPSPSPVAAATSGSLPAALR